jgi:hypothetical protein
MHNTGNSNTDNSTLTTSTEAPKVTVAKTKNATHRVNRGDLPTMVSPVSGLISDDIVLCCKDGWIREKKQTCPRHRPVVLLTNTVIVVD